MPIKSLIYIDLDRLRTSESFQIRLVNNELSLPLQSVLERRPKRFEHRRLLRLEQLLLNLCSLENEFFRFWLFVSDNAVHNPICAERHRVAYFVRGHREGALKLARRSEIAHLPCSRK